MYLRLSLDPRILLPLVMLGGLATSVALYQGTARSATQSRDLSSRHAAPVLVDVRPHEGLPTLLDPAASLRPAATASAGRSLLGRPSSLPLYPLNGQPDSNGVNPAPPVLAESDAEPTVCPSGMLLVDGDYCQVVGHVCLKRIDGPVERCEKYA